MRKVLLFLFIVSFVFANSILGQGQKGQSKSVSGGLIKGKVIDSSENVPMEYCNIVLFRVIDSTQINGVVTDKKGAFELMSVQPGDYYLKVSFIGYEEKTISGITIRNNNVVDLETIVLHPKSYNVKDVVVSGERAPVSYEIDKKVINVGSQLTSTSGSAVDVLENVPSITVDIEGNVSLRGSSNFTVLIDGRPSILDANDALEQIPASAIENIEIITNPSAKYDPEGTAGIINIILKKNKRAGISGVFNLNGGLRDKYGAEGTVEYKTEDIDLSFGADYTNRYYNMDMRSENITTFNNSTSYLNADGAFTRGRNSWGIRSEIGFHLSENDLLTFGGRYGYRDFESNSDRNYMEWSGVDPSRSYYTSISNRFRRGDFYALHSSYNHKFGSDEHKITSEFYYSYRNSDEQTLTELLNNNFDRTEGQKTFEKGPEDEFRVKIDYTLPFNSNSKFEAGLQGETEISKENTGILDYDSPSGSYVSNPLFEKETKYDESKYSIYSLYANEVGQLGYQTGLRAEYTYRNIQLIEDNNQFKINRWDLFPSMHFSYKITQENQVMASYTRRIDRPRGWYLEPFLTWMDAYNVRKGNPALNPEYIDSYEAGFQTIIGKSVYSIEAYYRINRNKIERIRSVYSNNVTLHSYANVGQDYSFGTELMVNFDPVEFWNVNLMGNLYNYKIEGQLFDQDFSRESFNWNTRFNNILKLWEGTQLQLNGIYNSPSVSAQGKREGFFLVNMALRKDFFNKTLSATLQIRDLLGTGRFEFTSTSDGYYDYRYVTRESPIIMLNLKLNLNSRKQDRRGEQPNGDNGGFNGGEDDF